MKFWTHLCGEVRKVDARGWVLIVLIVAAVVLLGAYEEEVREVIHWMIDEVLDQ